jgi:hypothetical protein
LAKNTVLALAKNAVLRGVASHSDAWSLDARLVHQKAVSAQPSTGSKLKKKVAKNKNKYKK